MNAFILVAALLLVVSVPAPCDSKVELTVRLTSGAASYRLSDDFNFELVRENTGTSGLFIYRTLIWGEPSKIRVFDSSGNEVGDALDRSKYYGRCDDCDAPHTVNPFDFVLLHSGESLGSHLKLPVKSFVKSPGDYEILVEYGSDMSEKKARGYYVLRLDGKSLRPDAPLWSEKRGKVLSNRIRIHISE